MIKWNEKQYHCPVEVSMDLLSGKWKCLMLWHLNDGTKRYKELERIVPGVSQKMLTQQLKETTRLTLRCSWYVLIFASSRLSRFSGAYK